MKKALALMLAVVMAFGIYSVSFAATNKIEQMDNDVVLLQPTSDYTEGMDLYADDTIELAFVAYGVGDDESAMQFENNGGAVPLDKITKSFLSNNKVTLRRSASKGGDLIESIGWEKVGGEIVAQVQLVEEFVSVKEKDLDVKVSVYHNNKKVQDIALYGTMTFVTEELSEGDDYVNMEEGIVVEPDTYLRGVTAELGEGVSVKLNMFANRKYYGTASQKVTSRDSDVLNQYPEIETVYTLNTINMAGAGSIVTFDLDDTYYVYNEAGNYIGTSNDDLPYSNKYYLANSRIQMGTSGEEIGEEESTTEPTAPTEPVDPEQPGMGGDDDSFVSNVNDNPGTGAGGFMSVAMVMGVVALAAAGAIGMKK